MKTLFASFDDGMYFDVGWEMDILDYWPQDTGAVLELYLKQPQTHGKSTLIDHQGVTTILDVHGPFYSLPCTSDYIKIRLDEFESIISGAINKMKSTTDTQDTIMQYDVFKSSITNEVSCNEDLKSSDIYFLKWSYDYEGRPKHQDIFKFYCYMEFVFINLTRRTVFKAVLGDE